MKLGPPDSFHVEASEGWLGLGNYVEAINELENIAPEKRTHPDVLRLRFDIYAKAQNWQLAYDVARIGWTRSTLIETQTI